MLLWENLIMVIPKSMSDNKVDILADDFVSFLYWLVDEHYISDNSRAVGYVIEKPWKYQKEYEVFIDDQYE